MNFTPVSHLNGDRLTVKLISDTPFELGEKWADGYRVYVQVGCKGWKVAPIDNPVLFLFEGETESTEAEFQVLEQSIGTWWVGVGFINGYGVPVGKHKFLITVTDLANPVTDRPEVVIVSEKLQGRFDPVNLRDQINLRRLREVVGNPAKGGFTDPTEIDLLTRFLARIEDCLKSGQPAIFDVKQEGLYAFQDIDIDRAIQFDVPDGMIWKLAGEVKFIDSNLENHG